MNVEDERRRAATALRAHLRLIEDVRKAGWRPIPPRPR